MANENLPAESALLKRLNEQRIAAATMRKEILERAAEGEDLSAEDNATFERCNKDIDRYGKLVADEIKRVNEDRDLAAAFEAGIAKRDAGKKEGRSTSDGKPSLAEMMRRDLIASKGGETRSGGIYQSLPEMRDLVVATATKGAELVPVTLVDSLFEKVFDDSALLQANPTILRTQSGETMKLPRIELHSGHDYCAYAGTVACG
jgi:HK97 family phage major capsid protein